MRDIENSFDEHMSNAIEVRFVYVWNLLYLLKVIINDGWFIFAHMEHTL